MKRLPLRYLLPVGVIAALGILAAMSHGQAAPSGETAKSAAPDTVTLNDKQLKYVSVAPVAMQSFVAQREAVGYVDFNQDKAVQVFSPWTGRISQILGQVGDDVRRGQVLYIIDSPDLAQAESTLISTAGVLKLTRAAKERAQGMLETQAVAQKDYEQTVSDLQTAEANYRAARASVHIFGRTDAEIDGLIATQRIDSALRIPSPIAGKVTARNAAEGMLAQPGNAPAPITVADITKLWLVANVAESDAALLHLGQTMRAELGALPGHVYEGRIASIGASVDQNTHTLPIRADVQDPEHLLRPQMLATFHIATGTPQQSVAIPEGGLVREGDGTMTVFVTADRHNFKRHPVQIGVRQNGLVQVLGGLSQGEQIATDGALLLSNALALQSR